MLDYSIIERKIEDRNDKTDKDPYESEFDGDNVQLNVDQQSYGELSINDDSDNVAKCYKQKSQRHEKS